MKLPIGYSDFRKIIENKFDFVDKSLFIRDIIDDGEVILITRPRRFGKTLNMSMLHYFFAAEVTGLPTQGLFDNLKITQSDFDYLNYQGKYPVIFLTFKDIKESTFDGAYGIFCKIIKDLYSEHRYLLSSPKLYEEDKEIFESILKQQATSANIITSLKDLTKYLYLHFGVKPLVLIDEYDTPIQSSYLHDYYDQMVSLFRNVFSAALKDNPFLFKSVLTGILRISKESLFSGLNNLTVYSVLHSRYSQYFGFTESEVSTLLNKANLQEKSPEIKNWYNGYQIGNEVIYNPWSLVNCIRENGILKPYWVNTSDNSLIKLLIVKSSLAFKEQFESLLNGNSIERIINENFVFYDLYKSESVVWSLFLMTGYLKIIASQETDQGSLCALSIPNKEIRNLYRGIIEEWLSDGYGIEWYNQFLKQFLAGDMIAFENGLKQILEQTISVHDVAKEPEAFYHGFMIGITASLYGDNNYELKSNRESGHGRYDYLIISRDPDKLSILLEFKKIDLTESQKNSDEGQRLLKKTAQKALQQIETQVYLAEANQRNIKKILKIGIAFCGKRFEIAF